MIKYDQTTDYNCFPTSIASILEIPKQDILTDIHPYMRISRYLRKLENWMNEVAPNYGLKLFYENELPFKETYWIADVPIITTDGYVNWKKGFLHAVIMNKNKLAWDVCNQTKRKIKPKKFIRGYTVVNKSEADSFDDLLVKLGHSFVFAGGYEWVVS